MSKPAYGQLQKLKGKSLDEADTPEKKNPEPKGNRLLLLELTDGVMDLQAMEYHPVAQLNPAQLLPGAKVNSICAIHKKVMARFKFYQAKNLVETIILSLCISLCRSFMY